MRLDKKQNLSNDIPLEEIVYKPITLEEKSLHHQPDEKITSDNNGSSKFLYVAAFIVNLITFSCGIAFGWTSPVLPKLASTNAEDANPLGRPVTSAEQSLIASLLSLGCMIGPLIIGKTADRIGRKMTLLVISLPLLASFLISAFAHNVFLFYMIRLVAGLSIGSVYAVLPIYLSEIAQDYNRGMLICLMGMFVPLGILFSFAAGPLFTVKGFGFVCAVPCLVFLLLFSCCIPESPYYLASIGDEAGVRNSLRRFRSKSQVQSEVLTIMKNVEAQSSNNSSFRIKDLFLIKGLRNGLLISCGLVILQQLSGISAVMCYLESIFEAAGSTIEPAIASILVGVIQVLVTVLTTFIVDRLGRRILLLISTPLTCLSLLALGTYFHLLKVAAGDNDAVAYLWWLPISSLLVYTIAFNLALGPIVWIVMAELFPSTVSSIASSLTSSICFGASFTVTLGFPHLSALVGMGESFWICSALCMIGTGLIYVRVPETKGKNALEIQAILEGHNSK